MRCVPSILLIASTIGTAFADSTPPTQPTGNPKPIEVVAEPVGAAQGTEPSLVPQLSATGLTGGLLAGTLIAWMKYDQYKTKFARFEDAGQQDIPVARSNFDDMKKWEHRAWVLAGATAVSAGVTTFLWLRYHHESSVSVQPQSGGASVSYLRAF